MLKGICVFSKNIKKAVEAGFDYVVLPGVEIAKMTDDEFNLLLKTINENNITVSGYREEEQLDDKDKAGTDCRNEYAL